MLSTSDEENESNKARESSEVCIEMLKASRGILWMWKLIEDIWNEKKIQEE